MRRQSELTGYLLGLIVPMSQCKIAYSKSGAGISLDGYILDNLVILHETSIIASCRFGD